MSIKSTTHKPEVSREQLERVCRMYLTLSDAAKAMGISTTTVLRLCKKYEIESPAKKKSLR